VPDGLVRGRQRVATAVRNCRQGVGNLQSPGELFSTGAWETCHPGKGLLGSPACMPPRAEWAGWQASAQLPPAVTLVVDKQRCVCYSRYTSSAAPPAAQQPAHMQPRVSTQGCSTGVCKRQPGRWNLGRTHLGLARQHSLSQPPGETLKAAGHTCPALWEMFPCHGYIACLLH
jgi:hypothetical protein